MAQQAAAISTPHPPSHPMLVHCTVPPDHHPPPPCSHPSIKFAGACLNTRVERHWKVRCLDQEHNTMTLAKRFFAYSPQLLQVRIPGGNKFSTYSLCAQNDRILPWNIPVQHSHLVNKYLSYNLGIIKITRHLKLSTKINKNIELNYRTKYRTKFPFFDVVKNRLPHPMGNWSFLRKNFDDFEITEVL